MLWYIQTVLKLNWFERFVEIRNPMIKTEKFQKCMLRPQNLKTSRGKDENGYEMYKNEKKYATLLFFLQ